MENSERFTKKLLSIYPDFNLAVLKNPRKLTFRLTQSGSQKTIELLREKGFELSAGPFEYSYVVESTLADPLSSSEVYANHQIYIQSLASMATVEVLEPDNGDRVIDLCAAPGSKTSLISYKAEGSYITACENNSNRFFAMKKNLIELGCQNITLIKENAVTLQYKRSYQVGFDKVLVDVPCSNEGLIRDFDLHDFTKWNYKLSKRLPMLQKKLLASGINLLKHGGTLVYSTCTYSPEENESVINWALSKFSNLQLVDIPLKFSNALPGFTHWQADNYAKEIAKCLRILPNDLFDGFFIACLRKL